MAVVTPRLLLWILLSGRADQHVDAPAPSGAEPRADLDEVARLFREGQARFDTSDYDGAIAKWSTAYESLPDDPSLAPTRALLMANLAQAHVAAHGVGGDIEHLRHADLLFEQYLATLDPSDTETRANVEAERTKIAAAIAAWERDRAAREEAQKPAPPPVVAKPEPKLAPPMGDERPRRYTRFERGLSIGGAVTLTFGIALTGAMGTFVWLRDQAERKGRDRARDPAATGGELLDYRQDSRNFNRLAISTGAAAATLVAIGLGLIGGAEAKRAHRVRKVAMRVSFDARSFGLGVGGRF